MSAVIKDSVKQDDNKRSFIKNAQDYKSSRRSSNLSDINKEKNAKLRLMSISNANLLLPNQITASIINDTFTPGKKKDNGSSKLQLYKQNLATLNIGDCNDILSTTTDKKTTDERVDGSFRTMQNKTIQNVATHRDIQERKTLLQIEDKLERELKFYQVKLSSKDPSQEKVPELLLKEAADETLKKLAKIAPQYFNILTKLKNCYNDCIRTSIAESQVKTKELKILNKELIDLKSKNEELTKDKENKESIIKDINKELAKLKKAKKEADKKCETIEQYANELKKKSENAFLGNCKIYENKVVLQEIKDLIKENEDIRCIANELKSEVEYGKQRESKLMYFLYLMQQKNYPVFDIFEQYIKDLPTSRFSANCDDKFKDIYIEQKKRMKMMGLISDLDYASTERPMCRK